MAFNGDGHGASNPHVKPHVRSKVLTLGVVIEKHHKALGGAKRMTKEQAKAELEKLFYEADEARDQAGDEATYNLHAGKSEAYSKALELLDSLK